MQKTVLIVLICLLFIQNFGYADSTQRTHNEDKVILSERDLEERQKRSDAGDTKALMELWHMYLYGQGVPKSQKIAYEYLQRAAILGHPQAQYEVGNLYDLVDNNQAQAILWYRKSAEQDYAPAQYNLGVAYAQGKGVKQDSKLALIWYEKAANNGDINAMYNAGTAYQLGQGVSQNSERAVEWFKKAALFGHGLAQFNLGAIYFNGGQIQKNNIVAYAWLRLSLKYGAEPATQYAKQAIQRLKLQLSRTELTQAEEFYAQLEQKVAKNAQDVPETMGTPKLYPQD